MHLPPPGPFRHPVPTNPKKLFEASPATLRRRFILGSIGSAVGLVCSGVGFYEVSVFNPQPAEWYGLVLFILGVLLLVAGILGLILAHPKLFDSGDRGI